jgi:signal peptidase I
MHTNETVAKDKSQWHICSKCRIVMRVNEPEKQVHSASEAVDTEASKPAPNTKSTRKRVSSTLSTIGILLLAPLIAILLTAYVFQSYQVDGPSMENTLHNNDRLIVWKLPRTWARITGHQYVPKRGDVVIVTESGLANYGDSQDTKQLVKRVIGLPGDHLVIKDNVITIYNAAHPNGFQPDKTLPYGQNGAIPPTTNNEDITLAKDELFICGDNRGDSLDSRIFGPIKTNQVVGKLVIRVFPLNQVKKF